MASRQSSLASFRWTGSTGMGVRSSFMLVRSQSEAIISSSTLNVFAILIPSGFVFLWHGDRGVVFVGVGTMLLSAGAGAVAAGFSGSPGAVAVISLSGFGGCLSGSRSFHADGFCITGQLSV
jgi:hypothetical protein